MSDVRVAVLHGFGINCDHATAAVFRLVGAEAERLHVNRLIAEPTLLDGFDILAIPGGFSFGDHLGSGRLLGNRLRFALREPLRDFVARGGPVIGICNGFQVLVKTGLLRARGQRRCYAGLQTTRLADAERNRTLRRPLGDAGV